MMGGWYDGGIGWGGWLVMSVGMAAFWALVVVAVVALFRTGRDDRPAPQLGRSPLDILDERFARGEIDRDGFLERRGEATRR